MAAQITNSPAHRLWTGFIGALLDAYFTLYHRWRIEGLEHVPAHGPALLIVNHVSTLEPVAVFPLSRRLGLVPGETIFMVGKRELFQNPLLARLCRSLGMFPLDRERIDPAAMRSMLAIIKAGHMMAIAPEGTRSATGRLQAFQPVLAKLAIARRLPILPVGVIGAEQAMPIGAKFPRPRSFVMRAGPLFELAEFYDRDLSDADFVRAAGIMRAHVAELLPEWMRDLPPPEAARRFTVV